MKQMRIVLADHDRSSLENNENVIERRVLGIKMHNDFSKSNYNNDIAILELDKPVDFDDKVKPACLPSTGKNIIGKYNPINIYFLFYKYQ